MLYVINEVISDHFASGRATAADVNGIEHLTMGVAEGSHRIGGPRKTLQRLAENIVIPERARRVFARAAGRVSEEGRLRYQLPTYGLVVTGRGPGSRVTSRHDGRQRVVEFPLPWFVDSTRAQRTALLGENFTDVNVLEIMARTALAIDNLPYLPLRFFPMNGGGGSTGDVLDSLVRDERLCVCVVDSDRVCPNGMLGPTAQAVQRFRDMAAYPAVEVLETRGRDLENSLPLAFYQNQYRSLPNCLPMTEMLARLTVAGRHDLRFHIDIEQDIRLRRLFAHAPGTEARLFWDTNLNVICGLVVPPPSTFPCLASGVCQYQRPDPCRCVALLGNTQGILEQFAECHKNDTGQAIARMLSPEERQEWTRLGLAVASWCCGDDKLRA